MSKEFIKKAMIGFAVTVMSVCAALGLTGCGENKPDSPAESETPSQSTVSESSALEPITVFFPEEYTTFVPKAEGEKSISVRGLTGIKVEKNFTRVYDPVAFEGVDYAYGSTTLSGAGCGGSVEDLAAVYGITESNSLNNEGNIWAVLMLDDDGNITYLEKSKVYEAVRALAESNKKYADYMKMGNNLLTVCINTSDGVTVDSFEVVHYVF